MADKEIFQKVNEIDLDLKAIIKQKKQTLNESWPNYFKF